MRGKVTSLCEVTEQHGSKNKELSNFVATRLFKGLS